MATLYPGALDSVGSTLPDNKTDDTPTAGDHYIHHNNLADAVIAIETVIGTNPLHGYANLGAAVVNKVDLSPATAQVILPTADVVALTVKQHNLADVSNIMEWRLGNNAIAAYMDASGIFSAQGLKIAGASLSSSNLSDGAQLARLAGPSFSGTPTAPNAAVDTATSQIATTSFVLNQGASATPLMDGTGAVGSSTRFARGDHVHPHDTSLLPLAGGTMTGQLVAAGAGIKFSDNSVQTTAPQPGVLVVTSLPVSPSDGETVLLKLGTTPFSTIMLTWDNALSKWVSEEYQVNSYDSQISHNTTVSTVSGNEFMFAIDHNLKVSAGLKLQIRILWAWQNQSGSQGYVYFNSLGGSEGDSLYPTSHQEIAFTGVTLSTALKFTSHCDLGNNEWRDLSSAHNAKQAVFGQFQVQSSASPNFTTTVIRHMAVRCRYVSV